MNNPYQWLIDFQAEHEANNRWDKLQIKRHWNAGYDIRVPDADTHIAYMEQGRALAARLKEPWWEALFEYWKCDFLLHKKRDIEAALSGTVRLMLEMRKPLYRAFPHRIATHLLLVEAYTALDPIGYASKISAALNDESIEWDYYESFYVFYFRLRTRFLLAIKEPTALEVAWEHYHLACHHHSERPKFKSSVFTNEAILQLLKALAIFDENGARQHTFKMAHLSETQSFKDGDRRLNAASTIWGAVGARLKGREEQAQSWFAQAVIRDKVIEPQEIDFDGHLAFHQIGGERESLLETCDEAIRVARHHAHWFDAATYLLKKCEIAQEIGLDWQGTAEKLREIAAKLPSQSHWEKRLAKLEEQDAP